MTPQISVECLLLEVGFPKTTPDILLGPSFISFSPIKSLDYLEILVATAVICYVGKTPGSTTVLHRFEIRSVKLRL